MVIPSSDSPREGSFATFELPPPNNHLNFLSFHKACLLSYSKFGSTTSTSKTTMDGIPIIVVVMWGFMKCKFWANFWYPSCNPPQLSFGAYIVSSSVLHLEILEFWSIFALLCLCHMPLKVAM